MTRNVKTAAIVLVIVATVAIAAYYYMRDDMVPPTAPAPGVVPITTRASAGGARVVVNRQATARELSGYDFASDPRGTGVFT